MRSLGLAIIALLTLAGVPASAADLTVSQVVMIHSAVQQMSCQGKVIKDGAKESFICEPYAADKLKPGLVWQIAEIQTKAAAIVTQYQRVRNQLLAALPRKSDGRPTEEAEAKFLAQDAELVDRPAGIDLPRFKRAEIEPLNLPPAVISALMPIIDADK